MIDSNPKCSDCGEMIGLVTPHVCKRIHDDAVHNLDGMPRRSDDMLQDIMLHQLDFMDSIGVPSMDSEVDPAQYSEDQKKMFTQFTKDCTVALGCETTELLDALPWKPWKKSYPPVDMKNVHIEIVDQFMFVLEIAVIWGLDAKKLHTLFLKKMQENFDRQKRGY